HARPGHPRHPCGRGLRGQDPLPRRRGRDLAHREPRAERPRPGGRGPHREPQRHARRVLRRDRLPHERERPEPRDAPRRHGPPGEVPAAHDPGLGLRGELRPPHPGAADGRDQPDVPRGLIAVAAGPPRAETPLAAKSPFELRVPLGEGVPESDVRTAVATGEMGFLHSFTTGSTVDGPGVRVVAWTSGCMWRCLYCHNPDTWTMTNGIPVTLA